MIVKLGIPVKRESVNLIDVHPEIRARLRRAFADVRIAGRVRVSSGARTYKQQAYLYSLYRSGRGNLAANPDRVSGGRKGSAHQVQDAGDYKVGDLDNTDPWAYAVDVGFYSNANTKALMDTLNTYGLTDNVPSEWWHYVALSTNYPIVGLFGRGSSGERVATLQEQLTNLGHGDLEVDGKYGPSTQRAVESFQRDHTGKAHGDWEPADQAAIEKQLKRSSTPSLLGLDKLPVDGRVKSYTSQIRNTLNQIDRTVTNG